MSVHLPQKLGGKIECYNLDFLRRYRIHAFHPKSHPALQSTDGTPLFKEGMEFIWKGTVKLIQEGKLSDPPGVVMYIMSPDGLRLKTVRSESQVYLVCYCGFRVHDALPLLARAFCTKGHTGSAPTFLYTIYGLPLSSVKSEI